MLDEAYLATPPPSNAHGSNRQRKNFNRKVRTHKKTTLSRRNNVQTPHSTTSAPVQRKKSRRADGTLTTWKPREFFCLIRATCLIQGPNKKDIRVVRYTLSGQIPEFSRGLRYLLSFQIAATEHQLLTVKIAGVKRFEICTFARTR